MLALHYSPFTIHHSHPMSKPRYRLAVDAVLEKGASITLTDNAAHYLTQVLRLGIGAEIALFNRTDGEWRAHLSAARKKEVTLKVEACLRLGESQRPPSARGVHLIVCFAPIKGGRMETIIEKATELGARVLQPVITARTIVDKVNLARAEAIAREAAEQSERIDWPEIREPVKLLNLLGDWPKDVPLIYGDESGGGVSINTFMTAPSPGIVQDDSDLSRGRGIRGATGCHLPTSPLGEVENPLGFSGEGVKPWAILVGPEGGFTPDEFAALARVKAAIGVGLGPRILRADTAVITLCAVTMLAWGDWGERPRFTHEGDV